MIKWKINKNIDERFLELQNIIDILSFKRNRNNPDRYIYRLNALDSLQTHIYQPSRKLKVSYSLEKAVNMTVIHGVDIEKQLTDFLAKEIEDEINRELINKMKDICQK